MPLEDYLLEQSSSPSADLEALESATRQHDWQAAFERQQTDLPLEQEMVSGKLEGQFLKMLVAISGAESVLEIGSFTGYASLAMAEALPEHGRLIACEFDAFTADFARRQLEKLPAGRRVNIRTGDARTTLNELAEAGERFDLVFIDADKPGYTDYFLTLLDRNLVGIGGLICADNTLFQGQPYAESIPTANGRVIAEFNRLVARDDRVEQVLVPIRDGLTIIRRLR